MVATRVAAPCCHADVMQKQLTRTTGLRSPKGSQFKQIRRLFAFGFHSTSSIHGCKIAKISHDFSVPTETAFHGQNGHHGEWKKLLTCQSPSHRMTRASFR